MTGKWIYNILIFFAALLLFVPFLGAVHLFDWDEINFAESAREMIVSHDYFSVKINFQPFWEKPPLFIWMQVLSMKIFGVNEFAARFPNAVCGITTLLILFNIGRKIVNEKFGLLWALIYASSLLPHFYFKSGIIDPWFNLFIFLGVYYIILFTGTDKPVSQKKQNWFLLLSAIFIGLAVLTKGPVALLIMILTCLVNWATLKFRPVLPVKQSLIYLCAVVLTGGVWFLLLVLTGHARIIQEFFVYQVRLLTTRDAGHGGSFFYHWFVLLIGCFPMSVFFLQSFRNNFNDTLTEKHFKKWMMILFWVVLILFSIVKTKIIHYSSLCYFPLSFLAAYVVARIMNGTLQWKKIIGIILLTIAILVGVLISALPIIDKYKNQIITSNKIKDQFAIECLKANVSWSGFEWIIGIGLIAGIIAMLILIRLGKIKLALIGIFLISLATVNMATVIIAPRVEQYSQAAAIRFYEKLKGRDCYVATLGFKSYAQYFYQDKQEQANKNSNDTDWLLKGAIDKPAYFVAKVNNADRFRNENPDLRELYRENGFVFLIRMPKQY
jgi:4-amino-4-deoxy-L-arabinose transferase-like glycosyltransferase